MKARGIGAAVMFVLAATAWIAVVAAQGGGPQSGRGFGPQGRGMMGPPPGGGLAIERMGRELQFTDQQAADIQSVIEQERSSLKDTMTSMRQAQHALDAAIMQTPDDATLQARVNDVAALQAQLALAHAKTEAKIYQMLSHDQQQKAQQAIASRMKNQELGMKN